MDPSGNEVWFTSDTHFGHKNILNYGRGKLFDDIEEHDEYIIQEWNKAVGKNDRIYMLGDISFHDPGTSCEIMRRLNGRKYLICGNHDKKMRKKDVFTDQFEWVGDIKNAHFNFDLDGKRMKRYVIMCHFPLLSWEGMNVGSWQLHGHCHGNLVDPGWVRRVDVGVDCNDFRPMHITDVARTMEDRQFLAVDHHRERSGV